MYFICENKRVITPEVHATTVYQYKTAADGALASKDTAVKMWHVGKPPKVYTVEGFYLVHESLFEKLLKEHSKQ
jgi:hypothetical protein